jgi:hypothetical protein
MPPVSGASTASLAESERARGSENVVKSRRAWGFLQASATVRCSATTVFPVPAEPDTRAGPANRRSTTARCEGCRKTPHRAQTEDVLTDEAVLAPLVRV